MLAIKENVGRIHVIRKKTYLDFCRDELHGDIKADLVNRYGGILSYFAGDAVKEAFIEPFGRLRSLGLIFRV